MTIIDGDGAIIFVGDHVIVRGHPGFRMKVFSATPTGVFLEPASENVHCPGGYPFLSFEEFKKSRWVKEPLGGREIDPAIEEAVGARVIGVVGPDREIKYARKYVETSPYTLCADTSLKALRTSRR